MFSAILKIISSGLSIATFFLVSYHFNMAITAEFGVIVTASYIIAVFLSSGYESKLIKISSNNLNERKFTSDLLLILLITFSASIVILNTACNSEIKKWSMYFLQGSMLATSFSFAGYFRGKFKPHVYVFLRDVLLTLIILIAIFLKISFFINTSLLTTYFFAILFHFSIMLVFYLKTRSRKSIKCHPLNRVSIWAINLSSLLVVFMNQGEILILQYIINPSELGIYVLVTKVTSFILIAQFAMNSNWSRNIANWQIESAKTVREFIKKERYKIVIFTFVSTGISIFAILIYGKYTDIDLQFILTIFTIVSISKVGSILCGPAFLYMKMHLLGTINLNLTFKYIIFISILYIFGVILNISNIYYYVFCTAFILVARNISAVKIINTTDGKMVSLYCLQPRKSHD